MKLVFIIMLGFLMPVVSSAQYDTCVHLCTAGGGVTDYCSSVCCGYFDDNETACSANEGEKIQESNSNQPVDLLLLPPSSDDS